MKILPGTLESGAQSSAMALPVTVDKSFALSEPQFYHRNNEQSWCYLCPCVHIPVSILLFPSFSWRVKVIVNTEGKNSYLLAVANFTDIGFCPGKVS